MKKPWVPTKMFTEQEVEAAMTKQGGFSKESLAKLGVPWPPPKGWRKAITKEGKYNQSRWRLASRVAQNGFNKEKNSRLAPGLRSPCAFSQKTIWRGENEICR